jgi:TolB-like protein/DNA-binding winged helix-turn-helix (wHTH) protein/Flp pilus assembly protein TadD
MEGKSLIYQFDDVRVDVERFEVVKADIRAHLEPKAFAALVFLIEHRGRLVEKKELLDGVWKDAFVTENAMTRVIAQLRKALGDDSKEAKYIETVPTRGYRFIADVQVTQRETPQAASSNAEANAADSPAPGPALRDTKRRPRLGFRSALVLAAWAGLVVLAAALSYFWILRKPTKPSDGARVRSIAVLPFKPLAADNRDEALEMGMADTLITKLSNIQQIIVRPISAVRKYNAPDQDLLAAGREQGVDLVLEGSFQKLNDKIRVTARLWSVADAKTLWADKCDQQCTDIFAVQDSIAEQVTQALTLKIAAEVRNRLTKHYTENTEAYQLYILGRFHYGKNTGEGFRKAIEYYEQAIAKEPNYALAFAGLAYSYEWLFFWGYLSPDESVPKAKAAAARALTIDSALVESHLALAGLKFLSDWDFTGAEREYKQALELDPNNADAHQYYGILLDVMGRSAEAVAEVSRALELDPLSLFTNLNLGWILLRTSQYDRVDEQARKLIELEPNFFGGHWLIGLESWTKGRYEQAISEFQKAVALGGGTLVLTDLGCLYGIVGEQEKAQQVLRELQRLSAKQYVPRGAFAIVYAGLGEMDRAFEYWEQAYEERQATLVLLKSGASIIPGLRGDPRMADLLRRIGLPE